MERDAKGQPLCGTEPNRLGVRPGVDVAPDPAGQVVGGTGGLSVTPDDPHRLPPHVRPVRFGGRGHLPVFQLPFTDLGIKLAYRPSRNHPKKHGYIEPRAEMSLNGYQEALALTQSAWTELI